MNWSSVFRHLTRNECCLVLIWLMLSNKYEICFKMLHILVQYYYYNNPEKMIPDILNPRRVAEII